MLAAVSLLSGCASMLPGSVSYRIEPAGDQYALACLHSSSGNCHVRIDATDRSTRYATVAAGTTQVLRHAELGASICVSDSAPGGLICKLQNAVLGPAGAVVSHH